MLSLRVPICALACVLALPALAPAAPADATLFRLFLLDGSTVVTYGEFARVDDRVVFSMPLGALDDAHLHVVTLPSADVDWPRTERYAQSVRYEHYAATRGEQEFEALSTQVASALNAIATTTDRARALEIAQQARRTLAAWPQAHYGYRQQDVREILTVLDESISTLRAASGATAFDVSLQAFTDVQLEPVLNAPTPRELLEQAFHVASVTPAPSERLALLQAILDAFNSADPAARIKEAAKLRQLVARQLREEIETEHKYAELSGRIVQAARRAAADARVADVERVLNDISKEDSRLGYRRPDVIDGLHASVQAQVDAARRLRLARDQWIERRRLYRDYTKSTGALMFQLAKSQSALEAIRRLDGPSAGALEKLRKRLNGGVAQLQQLDIPDPWRSTHGLVITAWRFAETAVRNRQDAIKSGRIATAWEASSAAAAALLMISRAQQEIHALLEPPQLQ